LYQFDGGEEVGREVVKVERVKTTTQAEAKDDIRLLVCMGMI
jgi:hypothetical protein